MRSVSARRAAPVLAATGGARAPPPARRRRADPRPANRHVRDAHGRARRRSSEGAARAAGEQALPDRLRRGDRCHVGARDGQGLGRCAGRGDRLRRGRALGDPRRADRGCVRDPARSISTSASASRRGTSRTHTESGPVRLRLRRRWPWADVRAGARHDPHRRHGRPGRAVARRRNGRDRPAEACSRSARGSSSRMAATTSHRRTSLGLRSGRSTARSTLRPWSAESRRSTAGRMRSTRCAEATSSGMS